MTYNLGILKRKDMKAGATKAHIIYVYLYNYYTYANFSS